MTFLTPPALWTLLLVPAVLAFYVVRQRGRRKRAGSLELVEHRLAAWQRHLPVALFLVALAGLLVSLARPVANVTLPTRTGKVVLAFDTSNSMIANDVEPTRLDVAKQAALDFVDRQPGSVEIGIVAFTNGGAVVQPLTKNQTDVRTSIERLTPDGGTSIAEGIFSSLTAIVDDPIEVAAGSEGTIADLDIGYFSNAAIVLFTDGEDIGGADPVDVAGLAANSGVPVYTVGIGTRRGTVVPLDGFSIATALDEAMLTELAVSTGGTYFLAADDPDLTTIFDEIDRNFERQGERVEVTALFALAAMVPLALGAVLSLRWFGRISL